MREIKFRAKDFTGKWNYGYVIAGKEQAVIIPVVDGKTYIGVQIYVTPETVGQYTGLRDKNGKEIYEGDILKTNFSVKPFGVVEWNKDGYFFINTDFSHRFESNGYTPLGEALRPYRDHHEQERVCFEIAGNIHDNPE